MYSPLNRILTRVSKRRKKKKEEQKKQEGGRKGKGGTSCPGVVEKNLGVYASDEAPLKGVKTVGYIVITSYMSRKMLFWNKNIINYVEIKI